MALNKDLVKYFKIRWTGLASVIDGLDADDKPDLEYLEGTVTFTPNLPYGASIKFQQIAEPYSIIPVKRKVQVQAGVFNDQTRPYVFLEAPNMDFANPTDWNWKVDFDLYYKLTPIPLLSFNFSGEPNDELDLTNLSPGQDPLTGIWTAVGPPGVGIGSASISGSTITLYLADEFNTPLSSFTVPSVVDAVNAAAAANASKIAAGTSETNAAGSATAANASKVAAGTSETNANTSKNAAAGSATAAAGSATAADGSKTAAATSATNAGNSATAANASKVAAGTSETNAAGSATAANNSKIAAATSETNAGTYSGIANTKAGEAETARAAAVVARTGAETARTGAEQARDDAIAGIVPDNGVSTIKLQALAVTLAKLSSAVQATLALADTSIQPGNAALTNARTPLGATQATWNAGTQNTTNYGMTPLELRTATAAAIAAIDPKASIGGISIVLGNDAKLYDTRTPTVGTVPYDITYAAQGGTRTVGYGDVPAGMKLRRAVTFTEIFVHCETADASGNLGVQVHKNGAFVTGASATIAAANQVAGVLVSGSWSFAAGDILSIYVASVGTTPGKGVVVDLKGTA